MKIKKFCIVHAGFPVSTYVTEDPISVIQAKQNSLLNVFDQKTFEYKGKYKEILKDDVPILLG